MVIQMIHPHRVSRIIGESLNRRKRGRKVRERVLDAHAKRYCITKNGAALILLIRVNRLLIVAGRKCQRSKFEETKQNSLMSKMRAAQIASPGGPFEIVEREIP